MFHNRVGPRASHGSLHWGPGPPPRPDPALPAPALCELALTNKELHGTQDAKEFFPPFGN